MPNPFDDPAGGATATENPFNDTATHDSKKNPFDDTGTGRNPLSDVGSAIGAAANKIGIPKAMDLLSRPGKAGTALFAGEDLGKIAHAFTSGDADQYARDVDSVKQHLGLKHGGAEEKLGAPVLDTDKLPWWGRGLVDFGVETATDPTTVAGGAAARGIGSLAKGGLGIAAKIAPKTSAEAGEYFNHFIREPMTFGGSAKRELGEPLYNKAIAADNRQAQLQEEATRVLTQRFDKHIAPLSDEDKRSVYRILNGEESGTDPFTGRVIAKPHVWEAVQQGKALTRDMAALQADQSALRRLGYNAAPLANAKYAPRVEPWDLSYAKPGYVDRTHGSPQATEMAAQLEHADDTVRTPATRRIVGRIDRSYQLPDELRGFAAPPEQGLLDALGLRSHYLPGPREAAEVAEDVRPQPFNLLRPFAGNAMSRDAFSVGEKPEDLSAIDEAFRGAIVNAARQGTSGRLRAELGVPLDRNASSNAPAALEKLFERQPAARGDARTIGEKAADLWRQLVNIPKNTVATIGLKHGLINVPALALLSEGPRAAAEAIGAGVRNMRLSPEERFKALQQGVQGGVITPFGDKTNPIVDTLERIPGVGPTLGKASRAANSLTWAIDDAAKQAVFKRKVARGMSPDDAAAQTLREMVDYRHPSDFTKALGLVAPFATFRSRIPTAVASSAERSPATILALDRLTGGGASSGHGPGFDLSTPLSDVMQLPDEPQKYARATMADPVKALLSPIELPSKRRDGTWHDQRSYTTYGQPLLPHIGKDGKLKAGFVASQLAGDVPFSLGQDALSAVGAGEFPSVDWLGALLGGTLGVHMR